MSAVRLGRMLWPVLNPQQPKGNAMELAANEMVIPTDIESAVLTLKGIGELVTASEWKRAALVFALTYVGRPGGRTPTDQDCSVALSIGEFAALGIAGLSSRNTVRRYRRAWELAVSDGFADGWIMPGETVKLPDAEWGPYFDVKPDEPEQKRKSTGAGSGASSTSGTGEDDGAELADDEPDGHADTETSAGFLDLESKQVVKGLGLVESVSPERMPEAVAGQIIRLKEALLKMGKGDPNVNGLYLQLSHALGELGTVLAGQTQNAGAQ